jgi:hypothetical protein
MLERGCPISMAEPEHSLTADPAKLHLHLHLGRFHGGARRALAAANHLGRSQSSQSFMTRRRPSLSLSKSTLSKPPHQRSRLCSQRLTRSIRPTHVEPVIRNCVAVAHSKQARLARDMQPSFDDVGYYPGAAASTYIVTT